MTGSCRPPPLQISTKDNIVQASQKWPEGNLLAWDHLITFLILKYTALAFLLLWLPLLCNNLSTLLPRIGLSVSCESVLSRFNSWFFRTKCNSWEVELEHPEWPHPLRSFFMELLINQWFGPSFFIAWQIDSKKKFQEDKPQCANAYLASVPSHLCCSIGQNKSHGQVQSHTRANDSLCTSHPS